MIMLKRSDLSPVRAINTVGKDRRRHWISNADTERGRWREEEKWQKNENGPETERDVSVSLA